MTERQWYKSTMTSLRQERVKWEVAGLVDDKRGILGMSRLPTSENLASREDLARRRLSLLSAFLESIDRYAR